MVLSSPQAGSSFEPEVSVKKQIFNHSVEASIQVLPRGLQVAVSRPLSSTQKELLLAGPKY